MVDFPRNISPRWRNVSWVSVVISILLLVGYAVVYQNKTVEIAGGFIKLGESNDELHKRILKLQTESQSMIAPEVHNAVLVKLKQAESKNSAPNPELGKVKIQLKEREDKIAELGKQLAETSKELTETKRTLEAVKKDLQLSRREFQERSVQLYELKKKLEEISLANKNRGVYGFVQQLYELEKMVKGTVDTWNETPYVNSYNEILAAVKKELPTDTYLQSANALSDRPATAQIAASLRSAVPRLRIYLEQKYLK